MDFDLTKFLIVFDEMLPLTDADLGNYWVEYVRPDGIRIKLMVSVFDSMSSLIVKSDKGVVCAAIHLDHCKYVRVLDEIKKVFAIVVNKDGEKFRCLVSLLSNEIVEFESSA